MPVPALSGGDVYLTWTGLETDLIFNRGVELPEFAAFPLLETEAGLMELRRAYRGLVDLAERLGCGICLETVTWMANPLRARALGYDAEALKRINTASVALIDEIVTSAKLCRSGQMGPSGDAYRAGTMGVDAARSYHRPQVEALAQAGVDVVSAYTIGAVEEGTGLVLAARDVGVPMVLSFTVETDGRLPDGTALAEAIERVDDATDGAARHFLVNCAHPEHLSSALGVAPPLRRLAGVVANASRKSHAELDESDTLDDGNPDELGRQIAEIRRSHPWMTVFGGCCGTDLRHLEAMGRALAS